MIGLCALANCSNEAEEDERYDRNPLSPFITPADTKRILPRPGPSSFLPSYHVDSLLPFRSGSSAHLASDGRTSSAACVPWVPLIVVLGTSPSAFRSAHHRSRECPAFFPSRSTLSARPPVLSPRICRVPVTMEVRQP